MESTPPLEGPTARTVRRVGLLLLLLASLLPYHGCRVWPGEPDGPPPEEWGDFRRSEADPPRAPYTGINGAAFAEEFLRTEVLGQPFFRYEEALLACDGKYGDFVGPGVFLALPFWFLSLVLVRGHRPRTRWCVGLVLWVALGGLFVAASTDVFDMRLENQSIPWSWPVDKLVWAPIAGVLLLLRPRHRLEIRDVEATVSSQALLGLGLCLTTPCTTAWTWMEKEGHPVSAIANALWINYRSGFWLALVALALIAAPLFASEEFLRRLYDRCRPWRNRPSSPEPTPP